MHMCEWWEEATSHYPIKDYVFLTSELLPNDPFAFLCRFLSSFPISFCSYFPLISPVCLNLVDLAQERERTLGFW